VTTFTVGMFETLGSGICGFGPVPAETGSRAERPQPARRIERKRLRRMSGWVRMTHSTTRGGHHEQ
jgi:hypothetical protein